MGPAVRPTLFFYHLLTLWQLVLRPLRPREEEFVAAEEHRVVAADLSGRVREGPATDQPHGGRDTSCILFYLCFLLV